jgi:hypothetical protein
MCSRQKRVRGEGEGEARRKDKKEGLFNVDGRDGFDEQIQG